jgi:rod shape determining protein RodA
MRRGNILANLDWFSILLWLVMIIMGWLNIYSAVYSDDSPGIFDFSQRYGKQFYWIIAAIIMGIVILVIDHKFYEFFGYVFYFVAILLLMAVLVVGTEINGAKSWFVLGGSQIQPSEFAKPAVAFAIAKYLSGFNLKINSFRSYIITAAIIFTPALLILLQPDAGSSMVFFAFLLPVYREGFPVSILLILLSLVVLFIMFLLLPKFVILLVISGIALVILGVLQKSIKTFIRATTVFILSLLIVLGIFWVSGKRELNEQIIVLFAMLLTSVVLILPILRQRMRLGFIILLTVFISTAYVFVVDFAFNNILDDYQQRRVNIMLGLESDPQGAGYNLNQSKIAIGSGGFSGKGYQNGTQTKQGFVPEQSTDFIFCTVGEEWGFIGSIVIIGLFTFFLIRLVHLAERQRSKFARIFGYGILSVFFFHYFINIAMTIGLFPVIGIPLPFFSYGGSSLWAFTILLFVFLRLDASRMEHIN